MPSDDAVSVWAGWTLGGLGLLVGYVAWNNVDGGATGLLKDVVRTGTIPHGIAKGYGSTVSGFTGGATGSNRAYSALQYCLAQLGKPYRWGATGPDSFDCSGLMFAAYKSVGIKIARTTYGQIRNGVGIPHGSSILAGDLVFPEPAHVMMAIGDGTAVEAPHTGDHVKIISLPAHPLAVRRIG